MAQLTLNIPDAMMPRVIDALAARGHWTDMTGTPKPAYAKQVLADWLKEETMRYERREAERKALEAVVDQPPVDIS